MKTRVQSLGASSEQGCVVVVDKPIGPTSFDVVAAVRRRLHERRVGHTGTLDPLASGVLPVCVGEATKLVPFITDCDKTYAATVRLGCETASGDRDGAVVSEVDLAVVEARATVEAVEVALARFRGEITQRPPALSAIKIDGRPAYARVRAGETVEVPERQVTVTRLELRGREGPDLHLEVDCSKGTYIRSLAIDLGRALGVGGHLTALRRTRVGTFGLDRAVPLAELVGGAGDTLPLMTPPEALAHLPQLVADEAQVRALREGRAFHVDWRPGLAAVLDADTRLVAVVEVGSDGRVRVVRGFTAPPGTP